MEINIQKEIADRYSLRGRVYNSIRRRFWRDIIMKMKN